MARAGAADERVIDEELQRFLEAQPVYFVGTAPLAGSGHVNLSPKGLDTFRVLGPRSVAYVDYVGSGAETIAHLRENGRIVLMFCAFQGEPRIERIYGRGEALEPDSVGFAAIAEEMPWVEGCRAIIRVEVTRVQRSCGYGVPRMRLEERRQELSQWMERKGADGILAYQRLKNARSVDGLPTLRWLDDESPH